MAFLRTRSVRIAGIAAAVPAERDEISAYSARFGQEEIDKISSLTGVVSRRISPPSLCASDLCHSSAERLLESLGWEKESVDLLIFVSQTPDYILPATACVIHRRLALSPACAAFDVNLGCSGYVYGLSLCASLLSESGMKRALLLVGDTITKCVSPNDRSTALLFGDAGTATALEARADGDEFVFSMGTDGKGQNHLIIPAGRFRKPSLLEERESIASEERDRSDEFLYMNGSEVLSFTLTTVPKLIREIFSLSGKTMDDFNYFVFHQANRFMIEHLTKKMKIPLQKTPLNIDRYGNTSSASIPLAIVTELVEPSRSGELSLLLAGFGVGYSWAGASVQLEPGLPLELIEV